MSDAIFIEREYPIVDFGGHLVTDVPDWMQGMDDAIGPVHTDPSAVRERYDAAGVDAVVLSQPPFMGSTDVDRTAAANDDLLEIVDDYGEFYGLAALPVGAGGHAAAEEFERCLEAGYHGGALETMSNGFELVDEELEPVFDVAEQHDAPLFVHPKIDHSLQPDDELDSSKHEVLTDRYRLNAIFGREAALSESICKVINAGTLDRYPGLDLVFHHVGGNIASMLGRIHLHLDIGRWPRQDHVESFAEFTAQLEDRIYVDTAGFFGYHPPVRTALEVFPSTQVLFGTDAPYEPRSVEELRRLWASIADVASETDSEKVLGGNALDLLANVD